MTTISDCLLYSTRYSALSSNPQVHSTSRSNTAVGSSHSRNSSLDLRVSSNGCVASNNVTTPLGSRSSTDLRNMTARAAATCTVNGHSRAASLDLRHTRNSSADLNKLLRNDVALVFGNHHQGSYGIYFVRVEIKCLVKILKFL